MNKHQNGFGIVGILVIVAVLGIAGVIAWRVSTMQPSSQTTQTNTPTQASKPYLTIKEWSVKIPLSATVAGAYYEVDKDTTQSATDPTYLNVYSKETDALTGLAGVSCKGEYIAYLVRLPKDDPKWQPQKTIDDDNVSGLFGSRTVIGDYKYAVATHKQYGPPCFQTKTTGDYVEDTATSKKFSDVVTAFSADFKKIQAE